MRVAAWLMLLATPASAWEFTPGLPCLLTHVTDDAQIELTYDPTLPLYTVTIRRADRWAWSPVFAMRFDGPARLVISTDRHRLSTDGRAVTAEDKGFGNVLNGLQFNDMAHAILGDQVVSFPLPGAHDPVQEFRDCKPVPGA